MQTLHLNGLNRLLHPDKDKRPAATRFLENLGSSNLGLHKRETSTVSGLDSFSITQNISELLSPACGMTEEEKASYFAKIMAKLKSGKKLTAEEMRFLQAENPILYQQAARIQTMRDSLETRLKHCSSKEEAATIYTDAMSSIAKDDPMKEYIVAAYDDVYQEFRKTDEYQALPETEEDVKNDKRRMQDNFACEDQ